MALMLSRIGTTAAHAPARWELCLAAAPSRLASSPRGSKSRLGHTTSNAFAVWAARRGYASSSSSSSSLITKDKPEAKIAVLGGGLTGLSTALFLSVFAPRASITLYEANDRLGGWVHTVDSRAEDAQGRPHSVRFERGPRVVQLKEGDANSRLYVLLLHHLGIADQAWALGQDSELARRYIYHPDHLIDLTGPSNSDNRLIKTASLARFAGRMLKNALTEPALKGLLPALAHMLSNRKPLGAEEYCQRLVDSQDESIGSCLTRIFGGRSSVADNLASAMTHGIYGGDIWKLSIQSTLFARAQMFPYRLDMPKPSRDSRFSVERLSDLNMMTFLTKASSRECVTTGQRLLGGYTGFYGGMEALTEALVQALRKRSNVEIETGSLVADVAPSPSNLVEVKTAKSTATFDKVISTLFSRQLASITGGLVPALEEKKGASMHVVNIWFPRSGLNHPHHGFGYLISSQADVERGLLGVLFDSDREGAVWREWKQRADAVGGSKDEKASSSSVAYQEPPTGTKLTVLLRVPWENEPPRSPEQAEAIALAHVRRQFGIAADEPVYTQVSTARDCIPQHEVGHQESLAAAHAQLESAFGGRLAVAGPSYTAPGILPSIRAAFDVAASCTGLDDAYRGLAPSAPDHTPAEFALVADPTVGATGLGRFANGRRTMWDDLAIVDGAVKADYVNMKKESLQRIIVPRLQFGSLSKSS
ncbi:hypothetical protein PpBr36_07696 [Pyricularia pennisetigena]|uniref:hypothetical protein n=1 Tax=Pyricularia pennisetigena TaxID=1578925 RepID=UPI00114ECDE5|nr:hypothetical protein PpBr36_07696 [Pyricularia pennisetigena]TLS25814.1 hypothetical protein PpBr36_07696 [Pyricularia pennisetigena]